MESVLDTSPRRELLDERSTDILAEQLSHPEFILDTIHQGASLMHPSLRLSEVVHYMAYLVESEDPDLDRHRQLLRNRYYVASVKLGMGLVRSLHPQIRRQELDNQLDAIEYIYKGDIDGSDAEIRQAKGRAVLAKGFQLLDSNRRLIRLTAIVEDVMIDDWTTVQPVRSGVGWGFSLAERAAFSTDQRQMQKNLGSLVRKSIYR